MTKRAGRLENNVRDLRQRLGISQQELADLTGVTRQAISAVESGSTPSALVAIRVAKALGTTVEHLFWPDDDAPVLTARPAADFPHAGRPVRAALVRIGGQWVAHPLYGERAYRTELIPADGEGAMGDDGQVDLRLLDDPENLVGTVVLSGCSPALSLWARAAERWNPGLRVHSFQANSTEALQALARGEVHGAGIHLYDATSGEFNTPFVRRLLPGREIVLINLGIWQEGLMVAPGNPKRIAGAADLARPGVRLIQREQGAGSQYLLEQWLHQVGVELPQTDQMAYSHVQVAQAVAAGRADAGVGIASVAVSYGLDFLPLQEVRYDMAFPKEFLAEKPVKQLLSTLSHRWVRAQLGALAGYDTRLMGEVVASIKA